MHDRSHAHDHAELDRGPARRVPYAKTKDRMSRQSRPKLSVPRPLRRLRESRVGFWLGIAIVLFALLGPFFSPYSPRESLSLPYLPPSRHFLLGTDELGRDGFSRVLWGGRSTLLLASLSTLFAFALALCIGLTAGLVRRADWL